MTWPILMTGSWAEAYFVAVRVSQRRGVRIKVYKDSRHGFWTICLANRPWAYPHVRREER